MWCPVAFYSDKASIFRVNRKGHGGDGLTQFGRAMSDLNIDIICANTAPAKGCAWPISVQNEIVAESKERCEDGQQCSTPWDTCSLQQALR